MISVSDTTRVAVVIPLYRPFLSESELFSIENTFAKAKSRHCYFVAPEYLAKWIEKVIDQHNWNFVFVRFFRNCFFESIDAYNELMLTASFYKAFANYEYQLIVQSDALLLNDAIDEWMDKNYSYIGAPWFVGLAKPVKPLRFLGVGNGGFSLRKTQDFIRFLNSKLYVPNVYKLEHEVPTFFLWRLAHYFFHKYLKSYNLGMLRPNVNEDIFWGILAPRVCDFFTVPPPTEALFFSFETEPAYLYQLANYKLPMGCHAWEKYDYDFWKCRLSSDLLNARALPVLK